MILAYWKHASRLLKIGAVAGAVLVLLQVALLVLTHGDPFIGLNLVLTSSGATWCIGLAFLDGKNEYDFRERWGDR